MESKKGWIKNKKELPDEKMNIIFISKLKLYKSRKRKVISAGNEIIHWSSVES